MSAVNERRIVLDLLTEVLDRKTFYQAALRQAYEKNPAFSEQGRAFVRLLSAGCIERLYELDERISLVSSVPVPRIKPVVRNILRMCAYQAVYMGVPPHAVCSEAVSLAKSKGLGGLSGFVNAVSRRLVSPENVRIVFQDERIRFSCPDWLIRKIREWYPDRADEILAKGFLQREAAITAHFHTDMAPEDVILASLREDGAGCEPAPYADYCYRISHTGGITGLQAFRKGWLQIQDAASALAAQCAAPEEGFSCLDLCAAPGGKSIYISHAMHGTGLVVSRDLAHGKLPLIEENRKRTHSANMRVEQGDASVMRPEDAEAYDLVLADVPCSGLGVIARKPDIKYRLSPDDLRSIIPLQQSIIRTAVQCVKPGGILLYSTCTINPAENDEQVDWILRQGEFETESLAPFLHKPVEGASPETGMLTLLPGVHGSDGFFMARLRKKKGGKS